MNDRTNPSWQDQVSYAIGRLADALLYPRIADGDLERAKIHLDAAIEARKTEQEKETA